VDHGGLHSDICDVPAQKERPTLCFVIRRTSGELLTWTQIVKRNSAVTFRDWKTEFCNILKENKICM
jgi:hypothetical protein